MDVLDRFFDTNGFMPHGMCLLWRPEVFWMHAVADGVIALAYYSIPIALIYFVRRRRDIVFPWVFYMFGAFILACGTTHVMGLWTLWNPDYPLDGLVKVATAGLSIATAIALWPLMPRALALASPAQLEQMNSELRREIAVRERAEAQARALNEQLETRVREQTASLRQANERLTAEIAERRKSDELLRAITENTSAVIYVKDLDGRYLMVNRRFCEIFHFDGASVMGRTDHDLFAKDAADAFRAMDERVARAGRPLTEEEQAPHDDGMHAYISVKAPLRDEHGRPQAVFGISTDITDLKRAEAALAESEDRARLIIETALDAVIGMDSAGAVVEWTPQAETTFGWTRDEALGRPLADMIIPQRYRERHKRGLARYLASGEECVLNKRIEIEGLHRDGREVPVELSITPIRTKGAIAFSGFARDITERKAAAAQLEAQLDRMGLLDQITRAIAERQDLDSIFQIVVRSIEDRLPADFACLCLYDRTDNVLELAHVGAKSAPLAESLAMPERARIDIDQNGLSRCVGGRLVYEPDIAQSRFPFPARLASGGLRAFVAAPLQVESQVFGALIVARRGAEVFSSGECEFLRQLSEHVALAAHQARIYAALQSAYDDLKQTQDSVMQQERLRALGQMASGIAHDFNNALTPIALYTESLLATEPNLTPDGRAKLEVMERALDDASHTVARMKDFYRQRDPELTLAPVRVETLIRQVMDFTQARWRDMAQERGVTIDVRAELDPAVAPILGVESELREALINLVFNAIDALPNGGVITLSAKLVNTLNGGPHVEIEVADTGVGMDAATQERCLEPFFTTKGERGSGLGLAMVYGAVRRHGGDVEIHSVPGEGTRVRLTFEAAPAEGAAKPSPEPNSPLGARLRLLLIDDDPLLLRALQKVLEDDRHVVSIASDGPAGVEKFVQAQTSGKPFDAVITDLGMPRMDGRRVAAAIKEVSAETPLLLLTGWGERLMAEEGEPAHIDRVLSKPPKLREIRLALAQCIEAASQRNSLA
jgi:PAS domain S-box-containing protein